MRESFAIAVLLLGCSSSATTTTGGQDAAATDVATGISADQACSDAANAGCKKLDACRVNGVALRFGSMDTCVARTKANCLSGMGAADTGRTPANEEACAVAYASASCTDYWQNTIAACQPPAGKRAAGAPCTYAGQCQSAFCSMATGAPCGTCAAQPTAGQSCATTQCGSGQVCVKSTSLCQPYGAAGAACDSSSDCQYGMACVAPASGAGTCQAAGQVINLACDRSAGPICDPLLGLYCSFEPKATAGKCIAELTTTSGFCGFTAGTATTGSTYTVCTGASQCTMAAGANTGTCVPNALEGKACDTTNGPACLAPARCVTPTGATAGTCQLPDPTKC